MKLSNQRRAVGVTPIDLSMTSMIDVVFLLLIFFLVTSTFVKPERQLASGIQVEESSARRPPSDLQPAIVEIFRQADQVLYRLGAITTTDVDDLQGPLEQFENKSEGAFVRVGAEVPFEKVAQAIGRCKAAGFRSVSYVPAN